jgi:hypothetical protein
MSKLVKQIIMQYFSLLLNITSFDCNKSGPMIYSLYTESVVTYEQNMGGKL